MLIYFFIPAVVLGLLLLPIIAAIKKHGDGKAVKKAFVTNICAFFGVMAICAVLPFGLNAYAESQAPDTSAAAESEEADTDGSRGYRSYQRGS